MARTGGFSTMLDAATRRAFNFLRGEVDTLDERVTIIESGGGGDFPEAPLDGQQYGRQSAAWSVIELDNGEHVLTGDPENPPAGLDAGQLLWDGVEGGSGDGGGGPHDHAEYALVEHDHDYLPLTGGTLTGDLQVDGQIKVSNSTAGKPSYAFTSDPSSGIYGNEAYVAMMQGGDFNVIAWDGRTEVRGKLEAKNDLQVDGGTEMRSNARSVRVFTGGSGNVAQLGFTAAGSENPAYGKLSGYEVWIDTGTTHDGLATELKVGRGTSTFFGNLRVNGTITGTLAFNIADGIDTRDVLERAETATMPAVDDEGVTTTDAGVESVTVNEVVTALLAKVKQLSAEIEELRGA